MFCPLGSDWYILGPEVLLWLVVRRGREKRSRTAEGREAAGRHVKNCQQIPWLYEPVISETRNINIVEAGNYCYSKQLLT